MTGSAERKISPLTQATNQKRSELTLVQGGSHNSTDSVGNSAEEAAENWQAVGVERIELAHEINPKTGARELASSSVEEHPIENEAFETLRRDIEAELSAESEEPAIVALDAAPDSAPARVVSEMQYDTKPTAPRARVFTPEEANEQFNNRLLQARATSEAHRAEQADRTKAVLEQSRSARYGMPESIAGSKAKPERIDTETSPSVSERLSKRFVQINTLNDEIDALRARNFFSRWLNTGERVEKERAVARLRSIHIHELAAHPMSVVEDARGFIAAYQEAINSGNESKIRYLEKRIRIRNNAPEPREETLNARAA